jgi:cytochrome c553
MGVDAHQHFCDAVKAGDGVKGIPPDPTMPVIWSQHQAYQTSEFKLGSRQNEPMFFLIQNMPQEETTALAEHLSQKPWPKLNQPRASEAGTSRAQTAIVRLSPATASWVWATA